MEWTQVYTILGTNIALFISILAGNIGMFLWATRQARSDFLHLDKKLEENRKETQSLVKAIQEEIKYFHNRLCDIERERNKDRK